MATTKKPVAKKPAAAKAPAKKPAAKPAVKKPAAKAPAKKPAAKPAAAKKAPAHTTWDTVQIARHPNRPLLIDYLAAWDPQANELHGDRLVADDPAMFAGLVNIGGERVVLVGHRKGRTTEEKIAYRFGMANPDGYRKAMRIMRLAEKFHLPIVTLVDTSGAFPGLDAEARGQAEAIAKNLADMSVLKAPIVVVVTGEGGSGGALGIAVGDRILMLEHAIYSVISPEGCASILWRDGHMAPQAASSTRSSPSPRAARRTTPPRPSRTSSRPSSRPSANSRKSPSRSWSSSATPSSPPWAASPTETRHVPRADPHRRQAGA